VIRSESAGEDVRMILHDYVHASSLIVSACVIRFRYQQRGGTLGLSAGACLLVVVTKEARGRGVLRPW
jgi:hypothetical protein